MKAQRQGSNLSIQIRLALCALGRDVNTYDRARLTLAEKRDILKTLNREYQQSKESK